MGDFLSRQDKLDVLASSVQASESDRPNLDDLGWGIIQPNAEGDWIDQRSESFASHAAICSPDEPSIFELRTTGVKTNRDAWNYSSSHGKLTTQTLAMIEYYNRQVDAFAVAHPHLKGSLKDRAEIAKAFVDRDPTKFSWERANFSDVARPTKFSSDDLVIMQSIYRPFHRRWVNAGRRLNETLYQVPRVYPGPSADNLSICLPPPGSMAPPFAALMTSVLIDTGLYASSATAMFPQYVYDPPATGESEPPTPALRLFDAEPLMDRPRREHNVTAHALESYRSLDPAVDRDDIFFYVYGVLHSTDYRTAFASDLKKSLPRIPQVSTAEDFWAFSKAGRELARLHTEYESVDPWPELTHSHAPGFDANHPDAYRVLKMKHPKITDPSDPDAGKVDDLSRIIYNDWITIEGIPERAYEYELGSRSAIAWVIESNRLKTDKASGIRNDPNDWATEHNDPTYILDLVGRVVTVSMRTLDIVDSLPRLEL